MPRDPAPTVLSAREFNRDVSRAKRAAAAGPVFVTDRGRPSHVLMTVEAYRRLTGGGAGLAELLHWPGAAEAAFETPRARDTGRAADLS